MDRPMILDCVDWPYHFGRGHDKRCWRPATPADGNLEAAVQAWTSRSGHGLLVRMELAIAAWLGVSNE